MGGRKSQWVQEVPCQPCVAAGLGEGCLPWGLGLFLSLCTWEHVGINAGHLLNPRLPLASPGSG